MWIHIRSMFCDVCNTGMCASLTLLVPTAVSAANLGLSWPRARSAPGAGALLQDMARGVPRRFLGKQFGKVDLDSRKRVGSAMSNLCWRAGRAVPSQPSASPPKLPGRQSQPWTAARGGCCCFSTPAPAIRAEPEGLKWGTEFRLFNDLTL